MRRSTLLLSVVLALSTLAGCSGGGPYCDAVDRGREPLTSFGTRTSDAFATYADVTADVAKVAPADVKKQWQAVAKATRAVVKAYDKADVRIQDMKDEAKVNSLSKADLDRIQAASESFNDTASQRQELAQHVHDECGIDLSEK